MYEAWIYERYPKLVQKWSLTDTFIHTWKALLKLWFLCQIKIYFFCLHKLFFNRTRFGPYESCYSPSMLHALPKEEEIFFVVRRYEASVLERWRFLYQTVSGLAYSKKIVLAFLLRSGRALRCSVAWRKNDDVDDVIAMSTSFSDFRLTSSRQSQLSFS